MTEQEQPQLRITIDETNEYPQEHPLHGEKRTDYSELERRYRILMLFFILTASVGITNFVRIVTEVNPRLDKLADAQVPPPSEEDLQDAQQSIREFRDAVGSLVEAGEYDQVATLIAPGNRVTDQLAAAEAVVQQEEANNQRFRELHSEEIGASQAVATTTSFVVSLYLGLLATYGKAMQDSHRRREIEEQLKKEKKNTPTEENKP